MIQVECIVKPLLMLDSNGEDLIDRYFPDASPEIQPTYRLLGPVLYYIYRNHIYRELR